MPCGGPAAAEEARAKGGGGGEQLPPLTLRTPLSAVNTNDPKSIYVSADDYEEFIVKEKTSLVVFCKVSKKCSKLIPHLRDAKKRLGALQDPIAVGVVMVTSNAADGSRKLARPPDQTASWSLRRALLTPQVHPGSLYRCGKSI